MKFDLIKIFKYAQSDIICVSMWEKGSEKI